MMRLYRIILGCMLAAVLLGLTGRAAEARQYFGPGDTVDRYNLYRGDSRVMSSVSVTAGSCTRTT